MYLGKICEIGTTEEVFSPPFHPYTNALLSAVPKVLSKDNEKVVRLEGPVPSANNPPSGCRFNTRCPEKIGKICERQEPNVTYTRNSHKIYCHLHS